MSTEISSNSYSELFPIYPVDSSEGKVSSLEEKKTQDNDPTPGVSDSLLESNYSTIQSLLDAPSEIASLTVLNSIDGETELRTVDSIVKGGIESFSEATTEPPSLDKIWSDFQANLDEADKHLDRLDREILSDFHYEAEIAEQREIHEYGDRERAIDALESAGENLKTATELAIDALERADEDSKGAIERQIDALELKAGQDILRRAIKQKDVFDNGEAFAAMIAALQKMLKGFGLMNVLGEDKELTPVEWKGGLAAINGGPSGAAIAEKQRTRMHYLKDQLEKFQKLKKLQEASFRKDLGQPSKVTRVQNIYSHRQFVESAGGSRLEQRNNISSKSGEENAKQPANTTATNLVPPRQETQKTGEGKFYPTKKTNEGNEANESRETDPMSEAESSSERGNVQEAGLQNTDSRESQSAAASHQ